MSKGNSVYSVIIEWNGETPPTTWYNRLSQIAGFKVGRKSKDLKSASPLADRGTDFGVVAQEGAIICSSLSLARTLAALAKEGLHIAGRKGAPSRHVFPTEVIVSEMQILDYEVTEEDREALRRIQKVHGRRGQPDKAGEVVHTITCMEELTSYTKTARGVANCPHCGGTQVRVRKGERHAFADPGGAIWAAWMQTRFAHGVFEIPAVGDEIAPPAGKLDKAKESEIVARLISSQLMPEIEGIGDRQEAFTILDGLFVARAYMNKDRRTDARLKALMTYFKRGGSIESVSLVEPDNEFDWFDLASTMGPDTAIHHAMSSQEFSMV